MKSDRRYDQKYDNHPRRRVDDYRPATLKRFRKSVESAFFGASDFARSFFDWFLLLFLIVMVASVVTVAGYILLPIFKGWFA